MNNTILQRPNHLRSDIHFERDRPPEPAHVVAGEAIAQGSAGAAVAASSNPTIDPAAQAAPAAPGQAQAVLLTQARQWHRIPQALKDCPQWCVSRPDKAPRIATTGTPYAKVNDSSTWRSFEDARAVAEQHGQNIGIVLHADDPFACIDLDVCNAETQRLKGQPHDPALWTTQEQLERYASIVQQFDSYTEVSTLGHGAHIWVRGRIGTGVKRDGIEIYSQERFMICTGNVWIDKPIENRQDLLDAMVTQMRGPGYKGPIPLVELDEVDSDMEVFERAASAENAGKFNSLCAGNWQNEYPSQSEADMALIGILCFYSQSNEQVRRLFRLSGLGKREKATKNNRSIDNCLQKIRAREAEEEEMNAQVQIRLNSADRDPAPIDPQEATAQRDFAFKFAKNGEIIAKIDYLIDPWLPRGAVIGCYGRGEAGKTSLTAQMCADASSQVSTFWISSEEQQAHIRQRHLSCGGQESTLGMIEILPKKFDSKTRKPISTSFNIFEHLEPALIEFRRDPEVRTDRPLGIVVLDAVVALVTWGKGESANDDAGVKRLIAFLFGLAERYGVTIIMLGHLNKGAGHEHIADAVTGSAAWTNSVRLAYMLTKDTESESHGGFVRTVKTNTGTHFGLPYATVPVHTLRERPDGKSDVLCGVVLNGPVVWGELALREMMADDDDRWLNKMDKKRERVQTIADAVLLALRVGPTTRKAVEIGIDGRVSRRHWQEADKLLTGQGVQVQNDKHNERIYFRTQPKEIR